VAKVWFTGPDLSTNAAEDPAQPENKMAARNIKTETVKKLYFT
jgi:hypothetical protein